ncbi:hypothetical protein YC2023_096486 [Brassica napus]
MSLPLLECKYVTEEFVREGKSGSYGSKLPSSVPMLRFLYELCWVLVRGELPIQSCKAVLEKVKFSDDPSKEELASCFADVVTQIAQDLTMSGDHRSRLTKLCSKVQLAAKWLVESQTVPQRIFQERCEEEFLWEAEMVKIKAQDLKGKEVRFHTSVRLNTRLLYQQTKFNLLREESEGYAKLVSDDLRLLSVVILFVHFFSMLFFGCDDLFNDTDLAFTFHTITLLCRGSAGSSHNASAATMGIIKSLIGHFDLDPNRVFDIVLDCFELEQDYDTFLNLIPIFPKSHASQILGFKFQYYQRLEVNSPVPSGLYKLTALLVKKNFISLESIYAHLLPKDEEVFEDYNTYSAKRFEEANNIGKINLAATGKDLMEDEKQGDFKVDLYAALDMETEAVAERIPELENNQTLGLLDGFLSVDDWKHANIMFERLAPLNPVAHNHICDGLFRLIEKRITHAYRIARQTRFQNSSSAGSEKIAHAANTSASKTCPDLKEVFQILVTVGPYLYRNTQLLQKICRLLRVYYLSALDLVRSSDGSSNQEGSADEIKHLKEARFRVEEALGTCLLPSLQLIPANPAVGHEIWEVMSLLPYEARYRLYGEWEKDDERNPLLLAARQVAKLDTRWILKRLAKENLKPLGRMVAKLAHANPMTVLRTIVTQIEAYRDMIAPVVDAFKYLTQLEYDILEYVVIERLVQGGRAKLKDDGINLSDWLQSLASFWGHLLGIFAFMPRIEKHVLCKKYPSMELRGLFQYLVNQLKRGQGIELVLLQELIQQMANVQYTENLTEDQLDAMAGSETLRYHATSFGMTRNNKALVKSSNRLRDSLLPNDEPKLAIPLLLLIAQHRSLVVVNADAPYIKMVTEQFDRCHGILLQYVDFLSSAVTPATAYAQLVPSLEELVHTYHLEPEVAFLVFRPVMRLFKCRRNGDVSWPLDSGESIDADSDVSKSESSMILDVGTSEKAVTWSDVLDTVRTMLPSKAWNSLSPDLYATFWGLTLYDLHVPRSRYESEISKQHAALKTLEEVADNSSSAITKRKKEKERIQESLDRLTGELKKHEEHVASVRRRLSREKDKWLSSCPDTLKINMEFLQRCIFPRCTFSMADSVYCAMFVHMLHSLGTPYFNTVNHIDVLICKTLQPMICCCTEYEVGRLGRFLFETLKIAYHWKVAKIKNDEREDLKVLATGVAAALSARKDQLSKTKIPDGRTENMPPSKSDQGHPKSKGGNPSDAQPSMSKKPVDQKETDESPRISDENPVKAGSKYSEAELKPSSKRGASATSTNKSTKQDFGKDDGKSGKAAGRTSAADNDVIYLGSRQASLTKASPSTAGNGSLATGSSKVKDDGAEATDTQKQSTRTAHSPRHEISTSSRSSDRLQKRANAVEDSDRTSKRRKADSEHKEHDSEARPGDRDRSAEARVDLNKTPSDDQSTQRDQDRAKDKGNERQDRDHRERVERSDKTRADDAVKARDKSMERYGRERSVERGLDKGTTRSYDRNKDERSKDDRSKLRHSEASLEKAHGDDRSLSQGLPPPPPLPPNIVPHSMASKEEPERRAGVTRHSQRLSPRHDERERRRSEENTSVSVEESKRRRDDDFRDRKRDDRETILLKGEEREREREREREKSIPLKDDFEASKRRKIKRDQQVSSAEPGEYSPMPHQSSLSMGMGPSSYEGREQRKSSSSMIQHGGYPEEPSIRLLGKEASSKMARRDPDPYP